MSLFLCLLIYFYSFFQSHCSELSSNCFSSYVEFIAITHKSDIWRSIPKVVARWNRERFFFVRCQENILPVFEWCCFWNKKSNNNSSSSSRQTCWNLFTRRRIGNSAVKKRSINSEKKIHIILGQSSTPCARCYRFMNINKLLRFKYAHKNSAYNGNNIHGNEITKTKPHRTLNII